MRTPDHPTLIRRMLDARLRKVTAAGPVLAASLYYSLPIFSCHNTILMQRVRVFAHWYRGCS